MISAIILAAGESTRMGQPKMLLPWGNVSILEHVIAVFSKAGIENILVVVGAARVQMEKIINQCKVRSVYNKDYANGEMLSSLQCGLRALALTPPPLSRGETGVVATLIGLGDQPQVEERSVRLICEMYQQTKSTLIVPSFQMRRGHPWLIARPLWTELLEMKPPESPRDFLKRQSRKIQHVEVNTPSIFADVDTPEDYQVSRP